MLKSTHRPLGGPPPLPAEWTEHKAPTGHSYYYNSVTKESTYNRPTSVLLSQSQHAPDQDLFEARATDLGDTQQPIGIHPSFRKQFFNGALPFQGNVKSHLYPPTNFRGGRVDLRGEHGFQDRKKYVQGDRPRSKHDIPGCEPWILVTTKLGRRFVHNPESRESLWKFPPDVMRGVVDYDRVERKKKENNEREEDGEPEDETVIAAQEPTMVETVIPAGPMPLPQPVNGRRADDESDEYEEVEATDDEAEENPAKRQKTQEGDVDGHVEFNEDDIAYQLAAMGEDYGLDPGEYGDGEDQGWEEGAEGLPLTEEDARALFKDMLDDHRISPYTPWDTIIDEGKIVEDDRYTVLANMKSRKDVWADWSRDRLQRLKEQREKEEKMDPRIPYLAFLQKYATPKLYWPEFRRKYKKEPEMKDAKLSDKEREKWYRDYINRLKLPESSLKSDLTTLLKSSPLHLLNRSTTLESLPSVMLTDIRYVSLRPSIRDRLIEAYIATSPPAPDQSDISPEEDALLAKQKKEREQRERALAGREQKVQEEKRRQRGALQYSKGMLKEGEVEIQKAMRVGREGLLSHLETSEASKAPEVVNVHDS